MDMTLILIVLVVLVASRPNVNTFNNCNNIHLGRWCTFTSAKTNQSAMTAILWDRNRFQAVVRLWGYTSSAVRSMGWADGTARPRRRVGSRLNLLLSLLKKLIIPRQCSSFLQTVCLSFSWTFLSMVCRQLVHLHRTPEVRGLKALWMPSHWNDKDGQDQVWDQSRNPDCIWTYQGSSKILECKVQSFHRLLHCDHLRKTFRNQGQPILL